MKVYIFYTCKIQHNLMQMQKYLLNPAACLILAFMLFPGCRNEIRITRHLVVLPGPVNGAKVLKNGKRLFVYGDPGNGHGMADLVLLTDFRRDVLWAGKKLISMGASAVAPENEKQYFASPDSLWKDFNRSRFHDYYCQTTKFQFTPINVGRYVKGGDKILWNSIRFDVFDTPGYTRGAVTYIAEIDGKKIAFTGNLIYGDGKIFDLYSYQDSFGEISGYHGYAARLISLISSLELIKAQKPDIIIPARGPVINDPEAAIDRLIGRVRRLYSNYLSISAYRWYFPERISSLADSIEGPTVKIDWMPYSATLRKVAPAWYVHISNSNLVMADNGSGFLIDCGTKDAYDGIMAMRNLGRLRKLDGLFITHYHDDHTDLINEIVREFGCPVYATRELQDILEHPSAYHLPCLTTHPVKGLKVLDEGSRMSWKDFRMTFRFFPGQTIYHDAVLFEKNNGESIFFIGDSFTPSGIDDYCLLNRNLLHPGTGYFYCIDMLRNMPETVLLSNQHVEPLFAFSRDQLDNMEKVLRERKDILRELLPFDDINYGIDEQWARIYPYGQKVHRGSSFGYSVKIYNHSPVTKKFILEPVEKEGFTFSPHTATIEIGPDSEGEQVFRVDLSGNVPSGVSVLGTGVTTRDYALLDWCEGIIEITE
jgi:glyoxylase-like metal-dependent hydrolase (beta-lactamase superfamily II)